MGSSVNDSFEIESESERCVHSVHLYNHDKYENSRVGTIYSQRCQTLYTFYNIPHAKLFIFFTFQNLLSVLLFSVVQW